MVSSAVLLLLVPVLLTLLSLAFGRKLRSAAEDVRAVGNRTSEVLKALARQALRVAQEPVARPGRGRTRVESQPGSFRDDEDFERKVEQMVEEFEAQAEAAAQQVEETVSRRG